MNTIKKGDLVKVIAGKDKGKKGTVTKVMKNGKLMVEGINNVKKHVKGNPNTGERGGIVIKVHPIDRSNVMLYDTTSETASRVGIKTLDDGRKVRFYKKTNEVVDV